MIKNYFTIAFRFLVRNKTYSFINIAGLAVGTLCCLYILLYVQDQHNYDKHHNNTGDIYRITTTMQINGNKWNSGASSPPIAPAMKNDFAEVKQFTRIIPTIGVNQHLLHYKDKTFYEKDAVFVDSTFFDVFTYHFILGNRENALLEPYSLVLLKSVSDKLFGNDNPIGKTIEINNAYGKNNFNVTAIVDESLGKSHLHANMFLTMNSVGMGAYARISDTWAGGNFANSYIKLNPAASAAALEKKLPAFLNKYGAQQLKQMGMEKILHLQPIGSVHTTTGYGVELGKSVSPFFLDILLIIAALIQIIACINFMNLSTARASKRAKEVGVRKVIGAERKDLIKQFLSESFMLSLLSVIIALPLLLLLMPYLNQITQADIRPSFLRNYSLWLMLAGIVGATGLVAGSYPAFYLSAFKAIKVIKGNFTSQISAAGIRRSLVVFQFVLSIVLIAGIIVIYSQLNYIKNKDLGFDANQKLIFSFYTNDARAQMQVLAADLQRLSGVKVVSKANNYFSQFIFNDRSMYLAGSNMANATDAQYISTDEFFAKANGIRLIGGRDFRLHDSGRVLVNETLVHRLGLKTETAPGTKMYSQYGSDPVSVFEIAGVMRDFNYNSLHGEVKPFMLVYEPNAANLTNLVVSVGSNDYKSLLGKIETVWHRNLPMVPFDYAFLDEEVTRQYETEITLSRIINSFTLIAIFISCLGLFGLAAFSAEQRKKEIGIRKVLGASVFNLAAILSNEFIRLVLIAMIIATPVAWWAMNKWLQGFVYRIDISWWFFAIAGILALSIAILTVGFQAIKAALANPVKSLRTE